MRHRILATLFAVVPLLGLFTIAAHAHPGSGIVVDDKGRVFFQDSTGRAILMVDARGQLTKHSDKLGGHWMALDPQGSFARSDVKLVERVTLPDSKSVLLVADGGAPVAVGRDGNLYYALRQQDGGGVAVGLTRISPDGKRTRFAPDLDKVVEKQGITGLAVGPDESLYVACPSAILKVKMDGTFTTIVSPVVVKDCDEELPEQNPLPYLRGLAVDGRGTVFAAANGCHCVVKVTPEGKVETVLKAERPWSPTGVAVFDGEVYVLEYTNALKGPAAGWQPRVRKVDRDGKVTTLATVPRTPPREGKRDPE
jgi:sugar lactone lactonase YvrE